MSKDKPTKVERDLQNDCYEKCNHKQYPFWKIDINGEEFFRPFLIFMPQILLLLGIIIYKFTKD